MPKQVGAAAVGICCHLVCPQPGTAGSAQLLIHVLRQLWMGHFGVPLYVHGVPALYRSGGEGVPSSVPVRNAQVVIPALPCQPQCAGETRMGFQSHLQMVTVTSGVLPTYIQK